MTLERRTGRTPPRADSVRTAGEEARDRASRSGSEGPHPRGGSWAAWPTPLPPRRMLALWLAMAPPLFLANPPFWVLALMIAPDDAPPA